MGCLYLDNTRLKGELLPIAQAALDNIKGTLKDVAREKCKEVHALLATRTKALGESCTLLVDFAPGTANVVQIADNATAREVKVIILGGRKHSLG